uniref:U-scoloptoxin(04)-Er1d n=1 Tax=Ethmostigmus rubripes TaxID=62613 RepID=TX41D_ETHRU|nr:RecName: Full=U-scoloptoxin(04)-Er1d; Short=U-SLPTX(04)-Er1d; AltName: Full=U-scoloptoxin-Er1.1b2c; Short=U-SLPTX-Er1.1b2c; Contains: RecName: Full=U-scoloptoxin-Er1.1b; Contains: RecName: Full=U-scoloptoxin-Er1.2c; Flags: Precursor [Ethmostigmus rubripes]AHY22584.1 U-SLPTX-Er1.1b2c precursor [Ethmostigmus rubripes]
MTRHLIFAAMLLVCLFVCWNAVGARDARSAFSLEETAQDEHVMEERIFINPAGNREKNACLENCRSSPNCENYEFCSK